MNICTVHVVRHGQTGSNAGGRIQGQSESPLSALGMRQAQCVAQGLGGRSLAAIYSSDLGRARQTATPLAGVQELDVRLDERLRERHYGVLEGLSWAEVEAQYPEIYEGLGVGQADLPIPGGESRDDLFARIVPAFDEIAAAHSGQEVAVVSHGGVLAALLGHVLDLDRNGRPPIRTLNGGISSFEVNEGEWKLVTWGAVSHLGTAISPRPPSGTMSTA